MEFPATGMETQSRTMADNSIASSPLAMNLVVSMQQFSQGYREQHLWQILWLAFAKSPSSSTQVAAIVLLIIIARARGT